MMIRSVTILLFFLVAISGCDRDRTAVDERSERESSEREKPSSDDEHAGHDDHGPDEGEWCAGHAIPESMCTKCHPELIAKFKEAGDWCAEHGFPESGCPICNPMTPPGEGAAEKHAGHDDHGPDEGEWCAGHAIPESMCTKCHPELIAKFKEAGDWCAEHGFPESGCPICNPIDPPGAEPAVEAPFEEGTLIRLEKSKHEKVTGIETTPAKRTPVGLGVRAPAKVEFDRNRVADVRAPFPGIVREVRVTLGDTVEEGDRLFVLESAEIGNVQSRIRSARQELATAKSNYQRQQRLHADGIASMRKVEVARQATEEAESRLGALQSSLRLAGAGSSSSSGRFTVRAPISGTVVRRRAVVGSSADESLPLATIADAKKMWAVVDVSERDAAEVKLGQPVTLTVDTLPGEKYRGEVLWVSPEVDERTRTVAVRAEVANPDGKLRANQFAEAEIGIAPDRDSVVVPRSAIQRLDDATVVFVRKSEGLYEPRAVEVGRVSGDLTQIRGSVDPGDDVVTTGAFLLRTELKRDAIGAGCCEVPGE